MIVNAHTHLYAGLVDDRFRSRDLVTGLAAALLNLWWRLDRALDERSIRAAVRLSIAEARLAGTDVVIDHHESPSSIEGSLDLIADACQELGMSALVCYGATERNGGVEEAKKGLDECWRFIRTNQRPLVKGAVGLHAAFTVSDETIRRAGNLCRELDVPLHLHVAEDVIDLRGFARLVANDALVPRSILAHGVHLTEDEVRQADDLGCWFVQNPRSNRVNAVGYPWALRASKRVALGTDGFFLRIEDQIDDLAGHETTATIAQRVVAGDALAHELGLRGSEPVTFDIEAIREEAAAEADRLLEKMNARDLAISR